MSKEAMKLALEALQDISQMQNHSNNGDSSDVDKAIKALEEALAKQEQDEPVFLIQSHRDGFWCEDLTCKKCYSADFRFKHKNSVDKESLTTSQQRTWVGLTDEQKQELIGNFFAEDWAQKAAEGLLHDYEAKLEGKK